MAHQAKPRAWYEAGYQGFEALDNFPDYGTLERYRHMLLQKTEPQVRFLARHLGRRKLRAMEFCCGNGRLLIGLAANGLLERGIGIDISRSRIDFGRRWCKDLKLDNIELAHGDVLADTHLEAQGFDIAVCVADSLSYFPAISYSAVSTVLRKMRTAVVPEGCVLCEVDQMSDKRRAALQLYEGRLRTWQSLPPDDRFALSLSEMQYDRATRILQHQKTFVSRTGAIDVGRVEYLYWYTPSELCELLRQHGFGCASMFADFNDAHFLEGSSAKLVLLAGGEQWRGISTKQTVHSDASSSDDQEWSFW